MKRLTKYSVPMFCWDKIYPCFDPAIIQDDCSVVFCDKAIKCRFTKDRMCLYLRVMDKLAAYENTGLEPEDVELLKEAQDITEDMSSERLTEILRAEKDGRLVVLPPNDPLTLEELREMEKEPGPIYIPGLGWRICFGIEDSFGRLALKVGVTARIYLDNYGEGFVAYRHKPEAANLEH